MSGTSKLTKQSSSRHNSLLCLALSLTAIFSAPDAEAQGIAPALKIEHAKLIGAGISPEMIRSALFLKMPETPSAMKIADQESPQALQLRRVRFHGSYNPGVWLRTQCHAKQRSFTLEECRGSVCKSATPAAKERNRRHLRIFLGEYGEYAIVRPDFDKQRLEDATFDAQLCQRSWPAWAVTAKTLSPDAALEVPHHLLVIQTEHKILLWNALTAKMWNALSWHESRGIFNQMTVSSDGRLLLKNNSGDALLLDFPQGQYISLQNNVASMSLQGLNSLFSSEPKVNEFQTTLAAQEQGLPSAHFGGLFWRNGYLNWSDVLMLGHSKGNPELKPYPDSAPLLSSLWSEQSGIEKSYLLFKKNNQLELFSSNNGNKSFVKVKHFAAQDNLAPSGLFFIHPEFLTRLDSDGAVMTNTDENISADFRLPKGSEGLQSGLDLLTSSRHVSTGKCRITHFVPKSGNNGWMQTLVLPDTPCVTGLGRSGESAGVVEFQPTHLNIFILK